MLYLGESENFVVVYYALFTTKYSLSTYRLTTYNTLLYKTVPQKKNFSPQHKKINVQQLSCLKLVCSCKTLELTNSQCYFSRRTIVFSVFILYWWHLRSARLTRVTGYDIGEKKHEFTVNQPSNRPWSYFTTKSCISISGTRTPFAYCQQSFFVVEHNTKNSIYKLYSYLLQFNQKKKIYSR